MYKSITFRLRGGETIVKKFSTFEDAAERLDFLDSQERETREFAPTDSGNVRFNYCAEADSLRRAIYFEKQC